MSTLDMNDPKYFDPFLKTLAENTDKNFHTENAVLLATNFGTDEHKADMKFIAKLQEVDGYLTYQNQIAKRYIVKDILRNVKKYLDLYGLGKIHKGLARKMYSKL
jgi:hypothetical protein|tara:strand:- start:442 stop:756 length:315 start_codon:yes stop_codon:yes gene_type:complete